MKENKQIFQLSRYGGIKHGRTDDRRDRNKVEFDEMSHICSKHLKKTSENQSRALLVKIDGTR
ncbi:hypothetical protein OUZ56_002947 [Daphnia magna]|uniref:Uncharacterized protein n=1 Tax=Daphnia magna TaxID=35525 RepID=A0ABR0A7C0_9CRUS|nr:hypothetical protein OUZ56_002947 [Daphnia magna]